MAIYHAYFTALAERAIRELLTYDISMKLGYIGLGKMGAGMVELLLEKGHEVVVFDTNATAVARAVEHGATAASSLTELISLLDPPRLVWLMVPYEVVHGVLAEVAGYMEVEDTIIDGGNSPYKDSMRRAKELIERHIHFLDAGVSGGPAGARAGACVMVGGEREVFEKYEGLFKDIAAPSAYARVGTSGAGHFVKMVHNGIEYGMMQSIAEGFTLMKESPFHLNLIQITDIYNHRSVIESRLVGWLAEGFKEYGEQLDDVSGTAKQSGEGLWTVEAAHDIGVRVPAIETAVAYRKETERMPSFTGKLLSAMRNRFGGHEVKKQSYLHK